MQTGGRNNGVGRGGFVAILFMISALVVGCSGGVVLDPDEGNVNEPREIARGTIPSTSVQALAHQTPSEIAVAAAQTFFDSAQVVMLAGANDPAAINRAASIAVTLGTPLLLTSPSEETSSGQSGDVADEQPSGSLNTELLRLGVRAVITVGAVSLHQVDTTSLIVSPAPAKLSDLETLLDRELTAEPGPAQADVNSALARVEVGTIYEVDELETGPSAYGTLPTTLEAERIDEIIVLATTDTRYISAVASARAAGARVIVGNSPASESHTVTELSQHSRWPVIGLGKEFAEGGKFDDLVDKLRAGKSLPAGGQNLFLADGETVRIVAVDAEVALAREGIDDASEVVDYGAALSAKYAALERGRVASAVEIPVATTSAQEVAYWIDQTAARGQLLTLVFTPTQGTLLSQVAHYSEELAHPHVGVRIDLPSGRDVDAGEVNDLAVFLQQLVRKLAVPQKLLLVEVHNAEQLSHPESLMPRGDDVAIVVTTAAPNRKDQLTLWNKVQGWGVDQVYWGWTLTPLAEDDDEEESVYPSPENLVAEVDPHVVTYR